MFQYTQYEIYKKIRRVVIEWKKAKKIIQKRKIKKKFEFKRLLEINNNYPITEYKFWPTYLKNYNNYLYYNKDVYNLKQDFIPILLERNLNIKTRFKLSKYDFMHQFFKKITGYSPQEKILVKIKESYSSNREEKTVLKKLFLCI